MFFPHIGKLSLSESINYLILSPSPLLSGIQQIGIEIIENIPGKLQGGRCGRLRVILNSPFIIAHGCPMIARLPKQPTPPIIKLIERRCCLKTLFSVCARQLNGSIGIFTQRNQFGELGNRLL